MLTAAEPAQHVSVILTNEVARRRNVSGGSPGTSSVREPFLMSKQDTDDGGVACNLSRSCSRTRSSLCRLEE
jgi:hypothetical protein